MSVGAIGGLGNLQPLNPTQSGGAAGTAAAERGKGFGEMVSGAVDNLDKLHQTSDVKAVQASTGQLTDVHNYMIAANQAQVATELTVAVRNKAVEAFNDIMRMQI